MPPAILNRAFIQDLFRQIEWIDQLGQHLIEHPKTGMLMVLVPAGKFLTDTDRDAPCEVDLPAFYVALHPVTNAQYARFVTETGHPKPEDQQGWHSPFVKRVRSDDNWYMRVWRNGAFPPDQADDPVVWVSWKDATAYCQWAGLRLPTELEWEKAARGLDGRPYPWGKDWDPNRCRNNKNEGERTTGVWRYGQGGSPFGALQLIGNVWEWCADLGVLRGGSWRKIDPDHFSVSYRNRDVPSNRRYCSGFRCVLRELDNPPCD